jgi:integrase
MPRLKLTDKGIRSLKPPSTGQVDYWDSLTPGFGIRLGHGGRKAFTVLTRVDGRVRRFMLAPAFPDLALGKAREEAAIIIKNAQRGIDPAAALEADRQAVRSRQRNTFGAVAAEFMQDHAAHLRTRDEMQRKLDVDLLPHWRDKPIAIITRADVKALLRDKARTSPIAANRLLSLVSKIFTWALDEEIVSGSPALRLPRYGEELERERTLDPDEIRSVWLGCDQLGYPFGPLFQLMLVTGQRRGEVAGMKWDEFDADGWRMPGARSKSKLGHHVPLSTLAREILEPLPQLGDHVFQARGDKPLQGWSKTKRRLDSFANLQTSWRLHDLRRTTATQLRTLGIDRLVVSKVLNHAEAGVTRIYDRYAADPEKAAALERWAMRLREIISGEADPKVLMLRPR